MPPSAQLATLAAQLLRHLGSRVELVSLEVQEASARLLRLFWLGLVALLCAGLALVVGVVGILIVFWDTHRLLALGLLFGGLSATALTLFLWLRHSWRHAPPFLNDTRKELAQDETRLRRYAHHAAANAATARSREADR
jgi:uncharacterized membrane protein YqjE